MQAGALLHIEALPQMTPFTQHKWEGGACPVFPLFLEGQGIARYEIRDALPFCDARKRETRPVPIFPIMPKCS